LQINEAVSKTWTDDAAPHQIPRIRILPRSIIHNNAVYLSRIIAVTNNARFKGWVAIWKSVVGSESRIRSIGDPDISVIIRVRAVLDPAEGNM
jgi:hypothetical protein